MVQGPLPRRGSGRRADGYQHFKRRVCARCWRAGKAPLHTSFRRSSKRGVVITVDVRPLVELTETDQPGQFCSVERVLLLVCLVDPLIREPRQDRLIRESTRHTRRLKLVRSYKTPEASTRILNQYVFDRKEQVS